MSVLHDLQDWYFRINNEYADPRVKGWFLMDSPLVIMLIVVTYLLFVYNLGPKYMKNREPINTEMLKIVYNLSQVSILTVLVIKGTPLVFKLNILCSPIDYSDDPDAILLLKFGWAYFMFKVYDLIDTVFIVLNKKYGQASILHVYHHASMIVLSWIALRYYGGGHTSFMPYINAIVHTIMYTYYLVTTFIKVEKNVWWKKYITQIQLLQFTIVFLLYIPPLLLRDCQYPKHVALLLIPLNLILITLFANFYYKTYIKIKTKNQ